MKFDLVSDIIRILACKQVAAAKGAAAEICMRIVILSRDLIRVGLRSEIKNGFRTLLDLQTLEIVANIGSILPIKHLFTIVEVHLEIRIRQPQLPNLAFSRRRRRAIDLIVAVIECRRKGILDRVILRRTADTGTPRRHVGILRFRRHRIVRIICADRRVTRTEVEIHDIAANNAIRLAKILVVRRQLTCVDLRCAIVVAYHIAWRGKRQLLRRDLARARHRDRAARRRRAACGRVAQDIVRRGIRTRESDRILDVLAVIFHRTRQGTARAIDILVLLRMSTLRLINSCRRDACAVVRCRRAVGLGAAVMDELVRARCRRRITEVRAEGSRIRGGIAVVRLIDAVLFQQVDVDRARRDATRTRNGIVIRRVERTRRAAAAAIVEFIVCERLTIRRVARLEGIGKNPRTIGIRGRVVDIFRRRRARGAILVVGLVVRSTDGELELVLVRLDDVLPRIRGSTGRRVDRALHLAIRTVYDEVVRAVVDLRGTRDGESRRVNLALCYRALAPDRTARGHRRMGIIVDRLAVDDIAVRIDELIVLRLCRSACILELDARVGNVSAACVRRFLIGCLVLILCCDVSGVQLHIACCHELRRIQDQIRIRLVGCADDLRRAVIRLVDGRPIRQRRLDRTLEDIAFELLVVDLRCIKLIVFLSIIPRHAGAVDIDRLVVSGIGTQRRARGPVAFFAEGHSVVVYIHRCAVAVHEPLGSHGNIACRDRLFEGVSGLRRTIVLALDLAQLFNIADDLALVDRDVRTRDVVAVLSADEHGFPSRIAPAATTAFTLRIRIVQFHKAAILRAVELDVIIRRTYARDVRVVVAALMRDSQIVGIVGASDVLAPIALRTFTLDIVRCTAR